MISRARRTLAAALVLGGASLAAQTVPASYGAAAAPVVGRPPVAVDDSARLFAGGFAEPDVLANDSDPDGPPGGDVLQVCRVGTAPAGVRATVFGADLLGGWGSGSLPDVSGLLVAADHSAPAGTYSLPYQACDDSYLAAATVRVRVVHPRVVTVTKTSSPGRLRVVNPSRYRAEVDLGTRWRVPVMVGTYTGGYWESQTLDASVLLAPHTSRVVRVSHRTIEWVASAAGDGAEVPLGEGVVRGITLPQHTEAGARESHTRVAVPVSRTAALPAAAARGATGGQGDPWPDDTFDPAYDLSTTVSPTVQDDSIAVYRGPALVEPLANDSDPDGGRLAVCHAYSADEGLFATALDDQLYVDTSRAAVGTHTITYSACNAHRRSSARITLHVTRAQRLVVEKIPGTPSRLRVTNPNPAPAWIDADDFARTSTAVVHWVGAGASVVIPFHHRYGGWVAGIGGGGRAGSGRLARVALTRRDAAADRSEPMDVHERALVGVLPAP